MSDKKTINLEKSLADLEALVEELESGDLPLDKAMKKFEQGITLTSYVRGAKRTASIRADGAVTILRVSSTLMEQMSSACQLRFNKVFLRSLITRLQGDGSNAPT